MPCIPLQTKPFLVICLQMAADWRGGKAFLVENMSISDAMQIMDASSMIQRLHLGNVWEGVVAVVPSLSPYLLNRYI